MPWPPPTFQVQRLQHVDLVAARQRSPSIVRRDPRLGVHQRPLEGPHARRLDRRLDVHPEVQLVEQHLQRRLEDAEPAGRPDAQDRPSVARVTMHGDIGALARLLRRM